MEAIETKTKNGYTVELHYDESPESPRTSDGNVGTFMTEPRHRTGPNDITLAIDYWWDVDNAETLNARTIAETYLQQIKDAHGARVVLALGGGNNPWYVMDPSEYVTPDERYVRIVALYFDTPAKLQDSFGEETITDAEVEAALRQEIKTYNQWAEGSVYAWVVRDADGNVEDSCGDYYDADDAMKEGLNYVPETPSIKAADKHAAFVDAVNQLAKQMLDLDQLAHRNAATSTGVKRTRYQEQAKVYNDVRCKLQVILNTLT